MEDISYSKTRLKWEGYIAQRKIANCHYYFNLLYLLARFAVSQYEKNLNKNFKVG